jgi:hypothetical protein
VDEDGPDGKVELVSPAWVELARRYLEKELAAAGPALDGVRFEICEVLTEAPEHLAEPGTNKVSWHIIIDGSTVDVDFGEVDALFRGERDYDDVLPIAKTVYAEHPEVLAELRAQRSAASMPNVPDALQPILVGLHDFLARRTM